MNKLLYRSMVLKRVRSNLKHEIRPQHQDNSPQKILDHFKINNGVIFIDDNNNSGGNGSNSK